MVKTQLTDRQKQILYCTVEEYILRAEPVGSKSLVEKYDLKTSPATVRNELAELESLGFLFQPHTSAGRVPTDVGYRFYVDLLMGKKTIPSSQNKEVAQFFDDFNLELEELLLKTSMFLSKATSHFALVFAPPISRNTLKHVDLIHMNPNRILVVLVIDTGAVLKKSFENKNNITKNDLQRSEMYLNKYLAGLHLGQILNIDLDLPARVKPEIKKMVKSIITEIIDLMEDEEERNFYIGQTSDIYQNQEYENFQKAQELISSLEKSYALLEILKGAFRTKNVFIKIGSENRPPMLQEFSLIGTGFWVDDDVYGSLGVVGPTRMDYSKTVYTVEQIAHQLSRVMKSFQVKGGRN